MKRSTMRKHVFKMLFRIEFHDESEMSLQDKLYLEDEENLIVEEADKEEITAKVNSIRDNLETIDAKISEISEGWDIERLGKVELAIIRLAVYEVIFDENVPDKVAINEAVELAKTFGGEQAPAFINAVLAKLVK